MALYARHQVSVLKDSAKSSPILAQHAFAPAESRQQRIQQATVTAQASCGLFAITLEFHHLFKRARQILTLYHSISTDGSDLNIARRHPHHVAHHGSFVLYVLLTLTPFYFEQRRLSYINMASLDQIG